jgi:hypothetical protein
MSAYRTLAAILLVVAVISCEGPTGPAGPPGDPNGSLSDPSVMPEVIYSYPGANTTGPYPELYLFDCNFEWCRWYSQFQVRFNKFMDVTSVRRAVRLSSALGDIHADTNFILSVGGDVFILSPVDSNGYRWNFRFRVGEEYSIGVDSTARDINGNALAPSFTATFVPEPYFRVMEMNPPDGATDVPTYVGINVNFNSRILPEILTHITIEPEIPGYWSMGYDSTGVGYQPSSNLPAGTAYTVTVDGTAEDALGNRIQAPVVSHFTTVPFRVTSASPAGGSTGVALTTSPAVYFSVGLDSSTIVPAFHFTPATPGTLNGVYYGTAYLSYSPLNGLLASTTYTMRFDSTLRDLSGNPLPGGYEFSFTTAPFSVLSTQPVGGATGVGRGGYVTVNTNAPIEYATIAGSIGISPSAVISSVSACDGCSSFQFYAPSGLAANTEYTVTIGTALRTKRGQALPAPYTFSFTTGPN